MINRKRLLNLLSIPTPSGYETAGADLFKQELSECCKFETIDNVGNCIMSTGKDDAPIKVMISAHIDEIGMMVQNIDEKGFIHFIADGGVDPKVLPGARVTIFGKNGIIPGVIGKAPIHVEHHSEDKDNAIKIKDMKIDIGVDTKEEASKWVSVGDTILVDCMPVELGDNRVTGRGLDDKAGVFVVTEVMKELHRHSLRNVKVYAVACTQEETSASGAVISGSNINPDYSIDFDVTFATDDEHVSPNEWGDIKLGKGGAIAHGVDCNPALTRMIKSVCETHEIPYQEFVVPSGCTDTIYIKQSSSNAQTALLSIPNRNMHTHAEVCDYRDLQSLVDMTVATILKIDSDS